MINYKNAFPFFLMGLILAAACSEKGGVFSNMKGPYLGQTPPGDVPELFAPGIVSSPWWEHSGAVFTPDGNELFWTRTMNEGREPRLVFVMHMKQENGVWSRPQLASFNRTHYTHINSASPDGKRLYFYSDDGGGHYIDKSENGWSEPRFLSINGSDEPGRHINEVHVTRSGNLYCTGPLMSMPQGRGIVRSRLKDGAYQEWESLGPHVNFKCDDPYPNHSPTVDPDERFVIFVSRRPGGYGFQDLYISFRRPDDTYGPAVNLGEKINSVGTGNSWPQLSPDGKYLFFTSTVQSVGENALAEGKSTFEELEAIQKSIMNGWPNIWWVNTDFIEELKTDHIARGEQ